jgi:adenylate cyclase
MTIERAKRRLAAILAADTVGYSRLMEANEAGTLAALKAHRKELVDVKIVEHQGRVVKLTGDGMLVEFPSIVNAVDCACEIQRGMSARNVDVPSDRRIEFRIGINLGDVIVEGDDIYGDGVNVAARLEGIAQPGGIAISGSVRDHIGNRLELQFEDMGNQTLKNIEKPVHVFSIALGGSAGRSNTERSAHQKQPKRDKPSIAVLPFDNMSGDPGQAYFSDGVTEDIITELSRFRSLFVIARNSSFALRGKQLDITEIARRLGVQFVVEGSVRRAGTRVRITAQLINVATGAHLWAERYDRELEDIFDIQDEVVRTIVATVVGRLEVTGAEYAKRKPPESLVAYDYVLRGIEQLSLEGEEHNSEAVRLFEQAVAIDPQYAAGHAYLALAIFVQWNITRPSGELERALLPARRALMLDESDSRCHRIPSIIYTYLRQYDRAEFHSDRSIALNANDALAALARAGVLRYTGRAQEGIAFARKAMQLNPYHPNWYWNHLALTLHAAGRYAEALNAYSQIAQRPTFYGHSYHAYVAACHAELGQMEEARAHAALALQASPNFSLEVCAKRLPFQNEADLQRFLNGFRKAGLPE